MQPEHKSGESLVDLERALKDLVPAPGRLDMGQTMFRAGQQSMRRQQRWQVAWPLSSACLALLSITLGVLLTLPNEPRIVYVPRDMPVQTDTKEIAPPATLVDPHNTSTVQSKDTSEVPLFTPSDNIYSRLALRELALQGKWDTGITHQDTGTTSIKSLRYQDWRSLLDDTSVADRLQDSTPSSLFEWPTFMNTKGS